MQRSDINEILGYIDPAACSYDEWLSVGMALKNEGYDCGVWDEWSKRDPGRYKPYPDGESCHAKWRTFTSGGLTMATIVKMAKDGGYAPKSGYRQTAPSKKEEPAHGGDLNLTPARQLSVYIETLFEPSDRVAYVTDDTVWTDGRWRPRTGTFDRTARDILDALKESCGDVRKAVGRWNEECGAWIRINAMDGKGIKDENVVKFRHALVESDEAPVTAQYEVYRRLKIPVACLVESGGKSLHAVVRIDAKDIGEYRQRVEYLFGRIEAEGIKVDRANRNPSRLSRMPGVTRKGRLQRLVRVNMGAENWDEWMRLSERDLCLPPASYPLNLTERPVCAPELIKGVMRFGQKMLVSGASKAAKSFFLIELGICMSQGLEFLGFGVEKTRVLYLNMEIDSLSFADRVFSVGKALGVGSDPEGNFVVKTLRGRNVSAEELVTETIESAEENRVGCVILDPIYKVMPGDENSAGDMTKFTNELDRLCSAVGCGVVYAHHHSKGAQGAKAAIDRGSGSGVLARDADTIADLTEMEVPPEILAKHNLAEGVTALEMDITTRDFPKPKMKRIYFDYPLHRLDDEGFFSECCVRGVKKTGPGRASRTAASKAAREEELRARKEARERELSKAFDELGTDSASATELARVMARGGGTVAAKRSMIYELCMTSERFQKGDRAIVRTK